MKKQVNNKNVAKQEYELQSTNLFVQKSIAKVKK